MMRSECGWGGETENKTASFIVISHIAEQVVNGIYVKSNHLVQTPEVKCNL